MGLLFQIQNDQAATATATATNNNEAEAEAKPQPSPPLLFFLGELAGETKNAICDPIAKTLTVVDFPELTMQLECLAAAHGWLLLISREATSLFFFNPLTRHRIDVPYRSCVFNAAAFSAPPTSPSCMVFAVERDSFSGKFNIDVLHVGKDKLWTRFAHAIGSSVFGKVIQVIYSKTRKCLYCVDLQGRISAFDMSKWEVLNKEKFRHVGGAFLVEFNEEIVGVKRGSSGVIEKVYKVKFGDSGVAYWEEANNLSDFTLFVGPYGACGISGLNEELHKKIFVAGGDNQTKCVEYEIDHDGEYKETMKFYATRFRWSHAPVWI